MVQVTPPEVLGAAIAPSPWLGLAAGGAAVGILSAVDALVGHALDSVHQISRDDASESEVAGADDSRGEADRDTVTSQTARAVQLSLDRERAFNDADNQEGGYLPSISGDVIGKYTLLEELGRGESSKVWLAKLNVDTLAARHRSLTGSTERRAPPKEGNEVALFAIKIYRCEERLQDSMEYERALMEFVGKRCDRSPSEFANDGICSLRDSFEHPGPHGMHPCLVFDVLGPPVDWLMRAFDFQGIPNKSITTDIIVSTLRTLVALERLHVIHTDLKPENLLFVKPQPELEELLAKPESAEAKMPFAVRFIDFGLSYVLPPDLRPSVSVSARMARGSPSRVRSSGSPPRIDADERELLHLGNYQKGAAIQTREYRAPEIILGTAFNCRADVWSLGCMAFELVTGRFLFDPKAHPDAADELSMDMRHLYEVSTVIGGPSASFLDRSRGVHTKKFFGTPSYEFRGPRPLRRQPSRNLATDVLPHVATYSSDPVKEAEQLADFILKCVQWDPTKRASPSELLEHPWLRK